MEKVKSVGTGGFDLYEITEDEWILNVKNGPMYTGTFKKVVLSAVRLLGMPLEEISFAVKCMLDKDHNAAHFGVNGTFIFSFRKDFSDEKVG